MISVTPLFQLSPTQTNEEVNTIKEATSRFGSPLNHRSLKSEATTRRKLLFS